MKNNDKALNKIKTDIPVNYVTEALTATADGVTPTINPDTDYVTGTGVNGQTGYLITLPTPRIGKKITVSNHSGYAFCLQTSSPANVGINWGKGAGTKLSIADGKVVLLECVANSNWIASINTGTAAS